MKNKVKVDKKRQKVTVPVGDIDEVIKILGALKVKPPFRVTIEIDVLKKKLKKYTDDRQ